MVSKENIQFNFCKILASQEVVLYDKHLPPKYHIHIKSFFIITMKDNKKSKLIITKKTYRWYVIYQWDFLLVLILWD